MTEILTPLSETVLLISSTSIFLNDVERNTRL